MAQDTVIDYDLKEVVANLVTEDDEPVDNPFSAKQQRLLVEPLYSSWQPVDEETGKLRKFFADSNIGIFHSVYRPPIVPDAFISLDVELQKDWTMKEHRAYFVWEFGKVPDVVVEIVSNTKGGEISQKKNRYADIDVTYYVVFDPFLALSGEKLRVFERGFGKRYRPREGFDFPEIGLSLRLWKGVFEEWEDEWLRWCDLQGNLILTGNERAALLAEKLRELGVDPNKL